MSNKDIKRESYDILEKTARVQAAINIDKWGLQDRRMLLLVMLEELGELTQAMLETSEDRKKSGIDRQYRELYDLMAVMYAYYIILEKERYDGNYVRSELEV